MFLHLFLYLEPSLSQTLCFLQSREKKNAPFFSQSLHHEMTERDEKRADTMLSALITPTNSTLHPATKCSSESPEKQVNASGKNQPLDKSDSNGFSCSTGSLSNNSNAASNTTPKNGYLSDANNNVNIKRVAKKKYSNEIQTKTPDELEEEYDGLLHVDEKNAHNTLQMLNVLRKNRQLCDLILQLDDDSQDIYCHQIILACNSKFFMEIFNSYDLEQARANAKSNEDLSKDEEKQQSGAGNAKNLNKFQKQHLNINTFI